MDKNPYSTPIGCLTLRNPASTPTSSNQRKNQSWTFIIHHLPLTIQLCLFLLKMKWTSKRSKTSFGIGCRRPGNCAFQFRRCHHCFNLRHHDALRRADAALEDVLNALDSGISGDFIAQDIRRALSYLGEISGEIGVEDLLGNIFGKFCIGK